MPPGPPLPVASEPLDRNRDESLIYRQFWLRSGEVGPLKISSVSWKVLLAGLLIREAFSFWTGNPYDLEVWIRTGHAVANGVNPYVSFWPAVPGVSFAFLNSTLPSAAYLPFWPALLGELYRLWEVAGGGNRFVLYFLIKQPPIWADVLTAALLYALVLRWTGRKDAALGALTFWSFFPYAIIISAIWGQFDSLVVVVILAALLYREPLQRNLLYGLGIFVKLLPVIYLPLEVFRSRGPRRLTFLVALVLPLALSALVFVAEGWQFTGIFATGQSQTYGGGGGMNLAGILASPPFLYAIEVIPYLYTGLAYLYVPGVIVAGWVGARWIRPNDPRTELRAVLLVTTIFLLLRWGLYEQYMIYLFALMVLDIAAFHSSRRSFLTYLWVLSLVFLLVNNDLGARFVTPLDTNLWATLSNLDQSSAYGTVRGWSLEILDAIVTVSLIQWVLELVRDRERPVPWLWPWARADRPTAEPLAP
jgi:hypothetical protein